MFAYVKESSCVLYAELVSCNLAVYPLTNAKGLFVFSNMVEFLHRPVIHASFSSYVTFILFLFLLHYPGNSNIILNVCSKRWHLFLVQNLGSKYSVSYTVSYRGSLIYPSLVKEIPFNSNF